LKKNEIFEKKWNFWKKMKFLKKNEIFEKKWNFWKNKILEKTL